MAPLCTLTEYSPCLLQKSTDYRSTSFLANGQAVRARVHSQNPKSEILTWLRLTWKKGSIKDREKKHKSIKGHNKFFATRDLQHLYSHPLVKARAENHITCSLYCLVNQLLLLATLCTNNKVGRRSIARAARVPQPTLNQPTWLQMSWQA